MFWSHGGGGGDLFCSKGWKLTKTGWISIGIDGCTQITIVQIQMKRLIEVMKHCLELALGKNVYGLA